MKVKYPIDETALIAKLIRDYGIRADNVEFIPMGDSAYSYIVNCADGMRYYLKLLNRNNDRQRKHAERLDFYLPLTWRLYHQGLFANLTYPIQTVNGRFKTALDQVTLVLFNYIEGDTLADAYPFSESVLQAIAKSVANIHRSTPKLERCETESFDISFDRDLVRCIAALEDLPLAGNAHHRALREIVLPRKDEVMRLRDLVRHLHSAVRASGKPQVLCHGDIWGGNLIRNGGELFFIDWEAAVFAPPERDLFYYIGKEFAVFFPHYEREFGEPVSINTDLLRFYAYRRHLSILTNWLMNILYRNKDDEQNENDLEMIVHHCMNRWDSIEPDIAEAQLVLDGNR